MLVALVCALAGCAPAVRAAEASPDPRPVVLTTFTVLADMTRVVAGDHLRVESLTKPGAEVHGYEPTPGDLRRAAGADLVLDNGLGLEAWFAQFIADADVPHVVLSEGIEPLPVATGAAEGQANPHAWMSPVLGQRYVATIARALAELDPAHAADYARNAEAYRAELAAVHEETTARLQAVPAGRRVLVTCEGAFSYLARDAGLDEEYVWAVNAEQQATPRQVAAVIDAVEERDVPAAFCESTVSAKPMERVVEATGARFGGTLYVDSLSGPEGPVPTYLDLLRHDTRVIADALTGRTP
ncbi:metal ABC transporter substrate-binding protein [Kineococcus glutinatus]|uniref:Metal ABC transporter substrate-binding protein n=1 Tax=Kineococcus glutinatus TaxID=1070872 RepID=A0ABP9HL24_9ACTN